MQRLIKYIYVFSIEINKRDRLKPPTKERSRERAELVIIHLARQYGRSLR